MCGIIGINAYKDVVNDVLLGLHRLEYRGYDSAGLSFIDSSGLHTIKTNGKVQALEDKVNAQRQDEQPRSATIGMGHTRWATHGVPSDRNAHPHSNGRVAIIHNGIIENYAALKALLIADGAKFLSETDSEVIVHLIDMHLKQGYSRQAAVRQTINKLRGSFSILVIFADDPNVMIVTKRHAPICVGISQQGTFVGSDPYSLSKFVRAAHYLENDDIAICEKGRFTIFDAKDQPVDRSEIAISETDRNYSKGPFKHYMHKEISEQPLSSKRTLDMYLNDASVERVLEMIKFAETSRIYIVACGTSLFAGMIAKHWLQDLARIPVEVEIASEFCYRDLPPESNSIGIFISQSGETADTTAALRFYNESCAGLSIGIVNNVESAIGREANICLPIHAGPEVGVATTKAFTSQAIVLACLTLRASTERGVLFGAARAAYESKLRELPGYISAMLDREAEFKTIAAMISDSSSVLYLGRGVSHAVALEGALKLKELSYIHAEAIAAGELKHGSIALVDEHMHAIVIAPQDKLFLKTMSNVQAVAARGGSVIMLSNAKGCEFAKDIAKKTIPISCGEDAASLFIAPILYTIPLQLIAYHAALALGHDVDQPRNLAKSVTVE